MKRSTTRWIGLVWLALVLNVLAPVIGYARIATAQGPLTVEFCHAGGAQNVVLDLNGDNKDDGTSTPHPVAPHCVYCPGFAANFALGSSFPLLAAPVSTPAYVRVFEVAPVFVRRSVRVAQPRPPPVTLI
ncbi:hypothetical protein P3T23_004005 [Paraburkholderia sp. GAS448]|uniref:DUF2946 domain-containing protein n=1 Tax=Paraburkholderia sp. GAS448 TaxID=3035136 RepID=UPI003D20B43F